MDRPNQRETTKRKHIKIFARYSEMVKEEYKNDPGRALGLSKSYFYERLSAEFFNEPHYIGQVIQNGFRRLGVPESSKKSAIDNMDERVRFILDL